MFFVVKFVQSLELDGIGFRKCSHGGSRLGKGSVRVDNLGKKVIKVNVLDDGKDAQCVVSKNAKGELLPANVLPSSSFPVAPAVAC